MNATDTAALIAETKAWLAEYGDSELAIHDYAARLADALEAARAVIEAHQAYLDSMMDGENDFTDASFHLSEELRIPAVS